MPYSVPTPPPASLTSPPLPTHSMGRPGHRRSYSAFSDERGPGTFTSLGALPRRKTPPTSATAKRFHFGRQSGEDDTTESSSDDDDENARRDYAAAAGIPPLKLKVQQNAYPFPKSSPTHSPMLSPLSGLPPTLASSPASTTNPKFLAPPVRPSPSRTASSPILLSNGKPLKSSLKSSSSTSNIPAQNPNNNNNSNPPHQSSFHVRARSAPSTPADLLSSSNSSPSPPNSSYGTPMSSGSPSEQHSPTSSTVSTPKNVHFPSLPTDLEHVRVFNRTARPASLLLPRTSSHQLGGREGEEGTGAEETETETERETDRDTENERERERESFAAALSFGGYGNFGNARGRHVAHLRGSHSMQPPQRVPRWSTGMVSHRRHILKWVMPIRSRPSCHRCRCRSRSPSLASR
ncbi:hypothetical protein D9758_014537 [Tetrapyrgos nigripes]|uniref:Uncharacterized protein n=1 Tax=Tetrapyrgos nigripes TaxID=182062 RepID=A0A8H5CET4_9AGAR|nr:hypothetical protein D9758_014537 [Tetrapyrgos nigripes]